MVTPLASAVLLVGCTSTVGGENPDGVGISAVSVEPAEFAPSVLVVRWTTRLAATSRVEVSLDDEIVAAVEDAALTTEHELRVQGLKAGRDYQIVAASEVGVERESSAAVAVAAEAAPSWVPALVVSEVDASRHEGGFVLMSVGNQAESGAVLVDRDGDVVWWAFAGADRLSTASVVRRDGKAVLFASQQRAMDGAEGAILEVALDGSSARTHPAPGLHHAFTELADGSLAYLAVDIRDFEGEAVIGDTVVVVDDAGEVREVFNAWDHIVPSAFCSHYEPVPYAAGAVDWLHANSLALVPGGNTLLVMARNADALLEVDPATGEIGLQISGAASADPFDHGHYSQLTADGILMMDNGPHRTPPASRAVEYRVDRDAGTIALTWAYWEPEGRHVVALGDVKKLVGGNRLVSWSTAGLVTEVADQDVVWQLAAGLGSSTGWVSHVPTLAGAVQ